MTRKYIFAIIIYSTLFGLCHEIFSSVNKNKLTAITGQIYSDKLKQFGVENLEVNPLFAFWEVLFINQYGKPYRFKTDINGRFNAAIPKNASYIIIFVDQKNTYQFTLCFSNSSAKSSKTPIALKITGQQNIELGKITNIYRYGVISEDIEKKLTIDYNLTAIDNNRNNIPDGIETGYRIKREYNSVKLFGDLDNDSIPNNEDIDIDGDAIPNQFDDNIDNAVDEKIEIPPPTSTIIEKIKHKKPKEAVASPPRLIGLTVNNETEIELKFTNPVKKLFSNISISDGIRILYIEKINDTLYKLKITPIKDSIDYKLAFGDKATGASGMPITPQTTVFRKQPDVCPPQINTPPIASSPTSIDIQFSEAVTEADCLTNYSITPELQIHKVFKFPNNYYRLITSRQKENEKYTINIGENIKDLSANPIFISKELLEFEGFSDKNIIKVDYNANGDTNSIDSAIAKAKDGTIIYISEGNYGRIYAPITKNITLYGGFNPKNWTQSGKSKTIIDGKNSLYPAIICSANITLINIAVKNAKVGVNITEGKTVIYGCAVFNNQTGIFISQESESDILNSLIINNKGNGISCHYASNVYVVNNIIGGNKENGIDIISSKSMAITNNIITGNDYGISISGTSKNEIPQILNNCFYGNNPNKPAGPALSIIAYLENKTVTANTKDTINSPELKWESNISTKPDWIEVNQYELKSDSNLTGLGTNKYNYIFQVLPEKIKLKIISSKMPIGILRD